MKIRLKMLLAPAAAVTMLVVTAAIALAVTWQLKGRIVEFHGGALQQYESSLTASGRLHEANALAYRTLTWADNLSKEDLAAARRKAAELVGEVAGRLGVDLQAQPAGDAAALHAELTRLARTLDRAMELSQAGANDGIAMMRDADKLAASLGTVADARVQAAREAADGLYKSADRSFRTVLWVLPAALVLAVLVTAGAALWVARSLLRSITQASEAAERLAAGDLSVDMRRQSDDEMGSLLDSLGRAVAGFRQALERVQESSASIHTASSEVAVGSNDLSARTEQQASSLQQTAASMEQLTGTVQTSASNAHAANTLAGGATEVAVRGGRVVGEVVETMEQIRASSQRIAEIIGVIDGIAFQTNLLALNAAVEAARAGDQGRGFAVVASEVRNLAQRSAQAAREIKGLIGANVERVATGSRLVGDAGQTMNEIVEQVRRVSALIAEIAAAAQEQSAGIGQVNQAVAQLDHMTQQNAALVEQSAAASQSMKDQARRLTETVAAFRLAPSAAAPGAGAA